MQLTINNCRLVRDDGNSIVIDVPNFRANEAMLIAMNQACAVLQEANIPQPLIDEAIDNLGSHITARALSSHIMVDYRNPHD